MNKSSKALRLLAAAVFALSLGVVAHAQQRTFVSSAGNDANACTTAAPCRTFQRGHDVVAAGGEVVALNSAGYGNIVINKSVTISGAGAHASISSGANSIGISIIAPATFVVLRELQIDGNNAVNSSGISQTTGKLIIDKCKIQNFTLTGYSASTGTKADILFSDFHNNAIAINVTGPGSDGPSTPAQTLVRINGGNITFNTIGIRSNGRGYGASNSDLFNVWVFNFGQSPHVNLAANNINSQCTDGPNPNTNPCSTNLPTYNFSPTSNTSPPF